MRCNSAGIVQGTGQFGTTNRTSAGTEGAGALAVREVQADLATLVFDLVPEATVRRRTQARPERKPRPVCCLGCVTVVQRAVYRLPSIGIHQR